MSGLLGNPRQSCLHVSARRSPGRGIALACALLLAACGGAKVKPMPDLPQPLLQPMSARVGVVLDEELRSFTHEETRGGGNWKVELGPGHEQFFRTVMAASFGSVQVFDTLDAARAAGGLQTLLRPRIEQYSFATANETGGRYWAVTLRYRIAILGPEGDAIDTLSLTGYGSARGGRGGSALTAATRSAMRDAAAKFLVQMPNQPLARRLTAGEILTVADAAAAQVDVIETVPIDPQPADPT